MRFLFAASLSVVNIMGGVCQSVSDGLEPLRLCLQREVKREVSRERLRQSVARDLEKL